MSTDPVANLRAAEEVLVEAIRAARRKGMTRPQIAAEFDVSAHAVTVALRGQPRSPRPARAQRIALSLLPAEQAEVLAAAEAAGELPAVWCRGVVLAATRGGWQKTEPEAAAERAAVVARLRELDGLGWELSMVADDIEAGLHRAGASSATTPAARAAHGK